MTSQDIFDVFGRQKKHPKRADFKEYLETLENEYSERINHQFERNINLVTNFVIKALDKLDNKIIVIISKIENVEETFDSLKIKCEANESGITLVNEANQQIATKIGKISKWKKNVNETLEELLEKVDKLEHP